MSRSALDMAEIASLIGDVARANILNALLDGRASTALELSIAAHVTPQTTSAHLAKLTEANLISVAKQGRHRYFRLATPQVARVLESIMSLAADSPPRSRTPPRIDSDMRRARTCYDHIAGEIGVAITDALIERGAVAIDGDAGELTETGSAFLASLGADIQTPVKTKRAFCRPCMDWSERRPHLAGRVGAAIATCCLEHGWLARKRGSRTLLVTVVGRKALPAAFGENLRPLCEPVCAGK